MYTLTQKIGSRWTGLNGKFQDISNATSVGRSHGVDNIPVASVIFRTLYKGISNGPRKIMEHILKESIVNLVKENKAISRDLGFPFTVKKLEFSL